MSTGEGVGAGAAGGAGGTRDEQASVQIAIGANLWRDGQRVQALEHFRQATILAPANEPALFRLTSGMYAVGNCRGARGAAVTAPVATRCSERIVQALAGACTAIRRGDDALMFARDAVKKNPESYELRRLIAQLMLYRDASKPAELLEAHRDAARVLLAGAPAPVPTVRRDVAGRPLRVGYVSQDFRNRSAAHFIEPIVANHDPGIVQVLLYCAGAGRDEMTERLKKSAAVWREIDRTPDEEAAAIVRGDGVDILVDLCGLGGGGRLGLFCRRPAPVQVTYMGYPWSTGLSTIDYRIIDSLTDPAGAEANSSEELVRLPGCFLCYGPPLHATEVSSLPAAAAGWVTFGSFNNLAKISDATLKLWAGALRAVPGSRLIIKSVDLDLFQAQQTLKAALEAENVDDFRIEMRGPAPTPGEHMATYNEIDIALDTFPYHGTTTTMEALWMGVPVVTLAGSMHHSRVGVSLLTSAGLAECIAGTPGEYATIAASLAADLTKLSAVRAGLRQQISKGPLCDAPTFTRKLEAAYQAMWVRKPRDAGQS